MTRTAADQAARGSTKHAGGRKRTVTPDKYSRAQLKRIDQMALAQCKDTTIARILCVDDETFKLEFSKRTAKKRDEGKARVMNAQFQGCFAKGKGAVTERVWWGKQHLEQSDKQQTELGMSDPLLALFREINGTRLLPRG